MKRQAKFDFSPLTPGFVLDLAVTSGKKRLQLPVVHTEQMGVLFLDVSGFTRFTEFASAKGHYGVENITGLLNRYFDLLNCILVKHHGQTAKYGGDSCLAVFTGDKSAVITSMAACQIEIQQRMTDFSIQQMADTGVDFQIHGGMAYGSVTIHIVGSLQYALNFFLSGEAIAEAYRLDTLTKPGEIIMSELMQQKLQSANIIPSDFDLPCENFIPRKLSITARNMAKHFIPAVVQDKLVAATSQAELRNAAIIFINISAKQKLDLIPAEQYQDIYLKIQNWVIDFDGTINKIDYSDKGYLVIITFGVPQSHTDLVERAFLCAWRISQLRTELKVRIGITACNIYAGTIGARNCYEYGIIGNGVNIAARLMSHAQYGEITLSETIVPRIRNRFEVSFLTETEVKGIGDKIKIFRLVRELPENWAAMQQNYSPYPVIARQNLIHEMRDKVHEAQHQLFIIHGPSGSGKSFLIYQISREWVEKGRSIFYYSSDQIASKRRLELFFQIIRRQLGIVYFAQEVDKVHAWAKEQGIHLDMVLLKKWLFAKADKEKEVYASEDIQFEHNIVLESLSAMLIKLLSGTELLIIDNLENLDSESMTLISKLVPKAMESGTNVVLSGIESETVEIFNLYQPFAVNLNPFSIEETQALANFILPNISPNAIHRIHVLTEGNPLFINELCNSLKSQIKDSSDLMTQSTLVELEQRGLLPESLENLFIRRYDSLDDAPKSVLKLAAILAKGFTDEEMRQYLFTRHHDRLPASLELMIAERFFIIRTIDPRLEYAFTNNIMRESIYRTILLSEKKLIHRKIALNLSQSLTTDLEEYLETIADHFIKAEDSENIFSWATRAGQKLLNLADYENSVYYLQAALQSSAENSEVLRVKLLLLEAFIFQGKILEAESLLQSMSDIELEPGQFRDRYVWLQARYYSYSTQYQTALDYITMHLPGVTERHYRILLQIDRLDCMIYINRYDEFEDQAAGLYAELSAAGDELYRGRMASVLGQFYLKQGYYANAGEYYKQRFELARKIKDYQGEQIALSCLGVVASRSGDKKSAAHYYEKALALAEKHGDRNGYSKILLDIGTLHRSANRFEAALDCYQRSLKLTDITQNKIQYSTVLYDIGELNYYREDYQTALEYFQKSLAVSEAISDVQGISFCCDAIGDVLFRFERYEESEATYLKNLELQLKINDREGIAHTWGNLGNLEKVRKNYDQAILNYQKQIDILSEVGDKDGTGRAWFNLAMVDVEKELYANALEKLHIAHDLFSECGAEQYRDFTLQQIEEYSKLL